MKEIFSNLISIFIEITTLVLSCLWWQRTREEEPTILFISALGALVISIFLRITNKPKISFYIEYLGFQSSPTRYNRLTSRVSQVGEMLGETDIIRTYKLSIVNNSNKIAFNPELYVHKSFQKLIFMADFSISKPISPSDKVEIHLKYVNTIEGSQKNFDSERKYKFPKEFNDTLRILLSYQDENEKKYYTTLKIENNTPVNIIHTHMDKNFIKVKVYEPLF